MHLRFWHWQQIAIELVNGIPIGSKGGWKNHVAVESKLSWVCF
jgi:hypothetical protein